MSPIFCSFLFLIWHSNFTLGILFASSPCGLLINRGIAGGIYPGVPCLNLPVAGFQGAFGTPMGGLPAVMPSFPQIPMRTLCSPPALCAQPLAGAMPSAAVAAPMLNLPATPPPPLAPIVPNFWVPPPRILQPPQPAMAPPIQFVPVAVCAMPCRKKVPCRMPMRNNNNNNNNCCGDFCCGPCCCSPCEDDIYVCRRKRRR